MKTLYFLAIILFSTYALVLSAQVAKYSWKQDTTVYTPITSGTLHGSSANDKESFNNISIGFAFTYNCISYTNVSVNVNGTLAMGGTIDTVINGHALSGGKTNNLIVGVGYDLKGQTGSELRDTTIGTAPNRTFIIQWSNYTSIPMPIGPQGNTVDSTHDIFNFQIRLYETSNAIEVIYGNLVFEGPYQSALLGSLGNAQIGLRGTSPSDFNNRIKTQGSNFTQTSNWNNTSKGTSDSVGCVMHVGGAPVPGLRFTWTPDTMKYVSGTTTQTETGAINLDTKNNQIIGIEVAASGFTKPFAVTGFTLTPKGSTNFAHDVSNVKIYFTTTNPSFDTTHLFGSATTLSSPITIIGRDTLAGCLNTNYFWVTYDVPPNAIGGDTLDAECTSITIDSAGTPLLKTPTLTSPAGSRIILSPAVITSTVTTICIGDTVTFTPIVTGTQLSWSWTFPGGTPNNSTVQNPSIVYPIPGQYDVTLTITTSNGTYTVTKQKMITVVTPPVVNLGNDRTICDTVTLDAGSGSQYQWSTGETTQKITVSQTGDYNVTVTNAGNCSGSDTIHLIYSGLAASIASPDTVIVNKDIVFHSNSATATSWHWNFGDGGTSQQSDITHRYVNVGTDTVTLIVSNGPCSDTIKKAIVVVTSIGVREERGEELTQLSIYPNPNNGKFILDGNPHSFGAARIKIINVLGVSVYEEKVNDVSTLKREIDLRHYSQGVYHVLIETMNGNVAKKIFIQ